MIRLTLINMSEAYSGRILVLDVNWVGNIGITECYLTKGKIKVDIKGSEVSVDTNHGHTYPYRLINKEVL